MVDRPELPLSALRDLCQRWGIQELSVFGSYLRNDFRPDSDIDFLVTYAPGSGISLFDEVDIAAELEAIVGRKVDLVSRTAIAQSENFIRREGILSTARALYAV